MTFTRSFWAKVVLTGVLCGVPPAVAMNLGKSAMFLSTRLWGLTSALPCTLTFTT